MQGFNFFCADIREKVFQKRECALFIPRIHIYLGKKGFERKNFFGFILFCVITDHTGKPFQSIPVKGGISGLAQYPHNFRRHRLNIKIIRVLIGKLRSNIQRLTAFIVLTEQPVIRLYDFSPIQHSYSNGNCVLQFLSFFFVKLSRKNHAFLHNSVADQAVQRCPLFTRVFN